MYRELRLNRKRILCFNGAGFHVITENGNFGFTIFRGGFSIKKGFNESLYYFKERT